MLNKLRDFLKIRVNKHQAYSSGKWHGIYACDIRNLHGIYVYYNDRQVGHIFIDMDESVCHYMTMSIRVGNKFRTRFFIPVYMDKLIVPIAKRLPNTYYMKQFARHEFYKELSKDSHIL